MLSTTFFRSNATSDWWICIEKQDCAGEPHHRQEFCVTCCLLNEGGLICSCNTWGSSHQKGQKIAINSSILSILYAINLMCSLKYFLLSYWHFKRSSTSWVENTHWHVKSLIKLSKSGIAFNCNDKILDIES